MALVSAWMVDKTELTVISGTFLGHRYSRRVIFDGFDHVLVGRFAGFGVGSWLELRGKGTDLDCDGASLGDIEIEYMLRSLYFAPILFALPGDRTPNLTMIIVTTNHYTPYPM